MLNPFLGFLLHNKSKPDLKTKVRATCKESKLRRFS
jgi:hypothetical protein